MNNQLINNTKKLKSDFIVSSAIDTFKLKGFNSTTMDDIARSAGFTKKTIYTYFKKKEDIIYEIMYKGFNLLNEKLETSLINTKGSNTLDRINKMIHAYNEFRKSETVYFEAIQEFQALDETQHKSKYADNYLYELMYKEGEKSLQLLVSVITDGAMKNEIRTDMSISDIALSLWTQTIGIMIMLSKKLDYINDNNQKNDVEFINMSLKIYFEGITPNE